MYEVALVQWRHFVLFDLVYSLNAALNFIDHPKFSSIKNIDDSYHLYYLEEKNRWSIAADVNRLICYSSHYFQTHDSKRNVWMKQEEMEAEQNRTEMQLFLLQGCLRVQHSL